MITRFATPLCLVTILCLICSCLASATQQPSQSPTSANQPVMTGALRIKTDMIGAQVILDGQEAGQTPLTLPSLSAGRHSLTLIKEGYHDHAQEVEAVAGKSASIFVVLKPYAAPPLQLPMKFQVMHRHVSGACLGVLEVTAEGLEFKGDDNRDVFQIKLREIRSVSRSTGAGVVFGVPGGGGSTTIFGVGNEAAANQVRRMGGRSPTNQESVSLLPLSINTTSRGYTLIAYEEEVANAEAASPDKSVKQFKNAGGLTKEVFEIVYRLWTEDLKARDKDKKNR